jgi:hypothetical protein
MGKHSHPPPYRGWRSTKLHLALIAMGLIAGGYALTGFNEHCFDGFVMGVLGGAAIYSGAATWEKFRAPPAPPAEPQGGP